MPSRRVFVGVFLSLALVAFAMGAFVVRDRRRFVREAETTVGTVVRLEPSGSTRPRRGPSKSMYRAVVAYRTAAGERVEFRDKVSSTRPRYHAGETVAVWYRPRNPRDAIIHRSWWSVWFGAVIALGLGVLFTGAAFFGDVMLRRVPKTERRYN